MENKNVVIYLDVSDTDILGVFGNKIHLLTHGYEYDNEDFDTEFECILQVPQNIYLKEWKKWLTGKKDYCERWKEYCGVGGYVHPENPKLIGKQNINKWNEEKGDYVSVEVEVYSANKFPNEPDFEHG